MSDCNEGDHEEPLCDPHLWRHHVILGMGAILHCHAGPNDRRRKEPARDCPTPFDTQGCRKCHTVGHEGKLGFTKEGEEKAQGFEGCISTLKAMTIIAKVPEDHRSATQRRRAQRFEEFGCATCHRLTPGKMGLTEVGGKLAGLHLGCAEVEKLVAGGPAPQR
jgi:hypothetical protein